MISARYALLMGVAPIAIVAQASPAAAQSLDERHAFNIAAQPVADALLAFSRQSNIQVVTASADVGAQQSRRVTGSMTGRAALERLLAGTSLRWRQTAPGSIVVDSSGSGEAEAGGAAAGNGSAEADIVVVGTNIRGIYPSSSPVSIYNAEEIARTAATTTEQFIQRLPQNLGTRTQYANNNDGTNVSTRNRDAVAGVDLRGLGPGTTLALLDGRRLGSSDFGRSVDLSLIPIAALARIEVLTDGASAIYGSDAIGGVVNFVLRDDFDGAETRMSYGGVTDGGLRQFNLSQTVGRSWGSGHALASYSYHDASPLQRFDRDYAILAGRGTLSPDDVRHNVLVTGSQEIGDRLTVSGDFAYAIREIENEATSLVLGLNGFPLFDTFVTYDSQTYQTFGNLAVSYRLAEELTASIYGSYSRNEVESLASTLNFNLVPQTTDLSRRLTDHSTLDLTASLQGELVQLPGGSVRFSLGSGQLRERYQGSTTLNGQPSNRDLGRRNTYAFAEVFVPIVGRGQNIPLVHRLEVSLAARYTRYDDTSSPAISQDFGDSIDPKVGIFWSPFDGLGLRATYGTSFRAPSLTETDPTGGQNQAQQRLVGGAQAWTVTFSVFPAPNLRPETAETVTLGFDLRPVNTGFRLSGTYYAIDYTNRIGLAPGVSPTASDLFTNPAAYPDAIYRAPSAAFLEEGFGLAPFASSIGPACPGVNLADRAAVAACLFAKPNLYVVDRRTRNLAVTQQSGLDLTISNLFNMRWGQVSLGANVTYILNYTQRGAVTSAPLTLVDSDFGQPADLRGRAFVTLTSRGFTGSFNINYVDGYRTRAPAGSVDSWVTGDLYLAYDFGNSRSALLNGLRLSLSAQNIFDANPPFVQFNPLVRDRIGFDAANANPLGRFVVVALTKRW